MVLFWCMVLILVHLQQFLGVSGLSPYPHGKMSIWVWDAQIYCICSNLWKVKNNCISNCSTLIRMCSKKFPFHSNKLERFYTCQKQLNSQKKVRWINNKICLIEVRKDCGNQGQIYCSHCYTVLITTIPPFAIYLKRIQPLNLAFSPTIIFDRSIN